MSTEDNDMSSEAESIIKMCSNLFEDFFIPTQQKILIAFAVDKIASETWRAYHSVNDHIIPMIGKIINLPIEGSGRYSDYRKILMWAALYHDVVYDVKAIGGQNERDSAEVWREKTFGTFTPKFIKKVSDCIEASYGHEAQDDIVRSFLKLDLDGVNEPFEKILKNELKIRKEYEFADWADYKEGRLKFLAAYSKNSIIKEWGVEKKLEYEAEYIKHLTPNIAIYPGSFRDYHVGHENIYQKANAIFDKVIIAVGDNPGKSKGEFKMPELLKTRQVDFYSGLLSDYIATKKYPVTIIRGLRNTTDMAYELNQYRWLQKLDARKNIKPVTPKIKMVSLFCDKEFEEVSSSAIKTIKEYDPEFAETFIIK